MRRLAKEGKHRVEMIILLFMIFLLILALMKWSAYKLSLMAVLLYYGEKGLELPSNNIIQEYRLKVVKKLLGIRES